MAREKLPQEMRAAEKAPPGPPRSLPEEAPSGSWGIRREPTRDQDVCTEAPNASWGLIGGYSPGLRPGLPGIVSRLRPAMAMDGIVGVKQRAGCPRGCVRQPSQPAMAMEGIAGVKWRRRESNPRPVMFQPRRLRAYSVNLNLVTGPPADRVPPQPARNKFNPVRIGR